MLRISQIYLGIGDDFSKIKEKSAKILSVPVEEIKELHLYRQSIDARKKQDIHYTLTVDVALHSAKKESQILKRGNSRQISLAVLPEYHFPLAKQSPKQAVVVGMGPAGLFAALLLARAGCPPVILERGKAVEERAADVARFWETGELDENSNVQFGEGGAGTFSDGKLTTGTKDPRNHAFFRILVEKGAPEDILYSHKPHIGTDVLQTVLQNIRKELLELGCDIRFSHEMIGIEKTGDQITALQVRSGKGVELLPASHVVLAVGHSARDTFSMLHEESIPIEGKSFAIGARIEHLQSDMGKAQYGEAYAHLPPCDYKLACHLPTGRSVFSFCVCPGGVVVNASSGKEQMVTNGMSYRSRDKKNINAGLLVGITPQDFQGYDDFDGNHPLAGMYFQAYWEKQAYFLGEGKATCQRVEDFLAQRPSQACGKVEPSFTSGVVFGDVAQALPTPIAQAMAESLPHLGHKVQGFDQGDALLTGIETRSSSPIRILRQADCQSALRGLYPCGEGAGYAGGIVSAAVDGMKTAEAILCPSHSLKTEV